MDTNSDTNSSVENSTQSTEYSNSKNFSSDSFDEVISANENQFCENSLYLDENHFSAQSDADLFDDLNLRLSDQNLEQLLETMILKYNETLRSISKLNPNLSAKELEDKKRKIVKRVCELKVKLVKLKEDEEFEVALRDQTNIDSANDDNPILFQRTYSFVKTVSGHKLVPSSDIYENEKRLNSIWKSHIRNSSHSISPLSSSPTTSCNYLFQSLPTSKIINLLKSNHLSHLITSYSDWGLATAPCTNPLSQLVCDQCLKKSAKSFNDMFLDALKFGKKSDSSSNLQTDNHSKQGNQYLVCIYCFFTIHVNCLSRAIRKCPKLFFDDNIDDLIDEPYSRLFNLTYKECDDNKKNSKSIDEVSLSNCNPTTDHKNEFVDERYKKRMNRIIMKICPEIGLAKQDFRCSECRVLLSPSTSAIKDGTKLASKPRLCDYSGLYFCENCHIGDTAIIPARVFHNWDFQPQPVSRAALQIISYLKNTSFHFDRPVLINLVKINSMLYGLVDELIQIKRLRSELCNIFKYISLCKQPSKPRHWISIMCQLGPHLLNENEINYLSFTDICDLKSLVSNLSELENLFIDHITNCESCKGKGFFCELCPNKEDVLFPFSPNTTICAKCNAVYHKNCFFRRNRLCTRCNRINDKNLQKQKSVEDVCKDS